MDIHPACDSGKEPADGKGQKFVSGGADPRCTRGDFIFPNGVKNQAGSDNLASSVGEFPHDEGTTKEKLKEAIVEINKEVSILIVEQDLGLALSLCNRGYDFEQGRICLEGSGKYLKGNPRVKEAYLGLA